MQKGQHCSPETKAKISAANKGRKLTPEQNIKFVEAMQNKRPETKEKIRDSVKKLWNDPEYRNHMSEVHKKPLSPKHRENMIAGIKEAYKRPEVIAKKTAQNRANLAKPEVKAKLSHASKRVAADPIEKERRRERTIKRWQDPNAREKQREMMDANPQWWPPRTPSGEDHPNWKGGVAFFPYCPKFNDAFKEHIREKFGRKCYRCGTPEKGRKFPVHHIDYNKNSICNGKEWAFVPLCHSHHAQSNFNRWYWFNLLINYWVMNPDFIL